MDSGKLNKIIIAIVILIIIVIIILISRSSTTGTVNDTAKIVLLGSEKEVVNQYGNYLERGYDIVDKKSSGYSVKIEGKVDTNVTGVYNVVYNLYSSDGKLLSSVTRQVYVMEDDLSSTRIFLKGNAIEYYFIGDFKDSGAEAYRNADDISNFIRTDSNLNVNQVGSYTIEYYIAVGTAKKSIRREVNIVDLNINKSINKINHTINLTINIPEYDYIVLPNGGTNKSSNIIYKYGLSELKDEYVFEVYLKSGSHKKYIIKGSELGADTITGSCSLSYANNTTTITMNVNDIKNVKKFRVSNIDFTGTTKVVNGYYSKVTVGVYNYVNQVTTITCTGIIPTPTPSPTPVPTPEPDNTFNEGIKTIRGHSGGSKPCGSDVTEANAELASEIEKYGLKTRAAVASAGLFLANYRYDIPYSWAGKRNETGLDPKWGCNGWGMDCTGFVKWAFIQAGFPSNIIPRSAMEQSMWGSFNASRYLYRFNSDNVKLAQKLRPGDVVSTPTVHMGLVIGVDGAFVQVVQESTGINVIKIRMDNGKLATGGDSGFTHFVLLQDFYDKYGN